MNIAGYAIKYSVVTLLLCILLSLGGLISYFKMGRLEDPEFTIKEAVIFTYYPGASAEEVESEVTDTIETAVQQLKQLKEVRSISRAGVSIVFAEMEEVYDKSTLPQVWDELRRKIADVAGKLPPGCSVPWVNDDFGDVYGVLFAVTADGYSMHELKQIVKDLRRELLQCEDVGRIEFWGVPDEAVYLEIDRAKLVALGVTPEKIYDAVQKQNRITYAGEVKKGNKNINLRLSGDYLSCKEIGEQLIEGESGKLFRLKDIAEIRIGVVEPVSQILRYNGCTAAGLGISTSSGGNVIVMGDAINQRLVELQKKIPVGIELHPIAHQGDTVKKSVKGFGRNLALSVAIVVILLVLFMGIREGFIIGAVLVLTILSTFLLMYWFDIMLHRISLGALIIALGMLVDNAIVVAEGIVVKSARGQSLMESAESTVTETRWPLVGATVIAILAFAAISLSKDMTGEWLASLFQVICISLSLSWLFAITVIPWLCVNLLPGHQCGEDEKKDNLILRIYRKWLAWCLGHRAVVLVLTVCLLFGALAAFSKVKQDFMPDMNRKQFVVEIWLPEGTHIASTAAQMAEIENYVSLLEGVEGVTEFIGSGSLRFLLTYSPNMPESSYGMLLVDVNDFSIIPELSEKILAYISQHNPDMVATADAFKLGPGGGKVLARISGHDYVVLRSIGKKIAGIMRNCLDARTVYSDWGNPVLAARMQISKAAAQSTGISRPAVANALAMQSTGVAVGTYRRGEDLLPVKVCFSQAQGQDNSDIASAQVWSPVLACWAPLGQVVYDEVIAWEDPVVRRLNRRRTLSVSCKAAVGTTADLFSKLKPQIEQIKLPEGYRLEWGGEHEEAEEANTKLMGNFPLAFAGMIIVTVILFNSIRYAVLIFMGLPLVVIGVAAGLLSADKAFGFMAMLGFLSLFGMHMKNEIVMLEQIKLERAAGKKIFAAVLDAAVSRVRPVTMAAFTTVLGMATLFWDAFFSPMAVTIMGGLSFATILTLIVVPVLYLTFFKE